MNPILQIQLGLLHHTTFGFLWPSELGRRTFMSLPKETMKKTLKNEEIVEGIFLAHTNFKSTFWVCASVMH